MRKLTIGVVAAALPVSLTLATAPPALAIYNGQAITTAPPWAAYITTTGNWLDSFINGAESSCTGTIVADGWVMTAAHCVYSETNGALISNSKFRVVLGRSNLNSTYQGGQWTVDRVVPDPSFSHTTLNHDVALLHLKGALPTSAMPLPLGPADLTLGNGQGLVAYGYGLISETYSNAAIKKQDWTKYQGVSTAYLRSTTAGSYSTDDSCNTTYKWCLRHNGPSEILNGDSGGPWVPDVTNRYVVGVTSANFSPLPASNGTVDWRIHGATRVTEASIHSFIVDTTGIVHPAFGRIVRNGDTGASWLFQDDGFAHPILTGAAYNCLIGQGHTVANLSAFQLAEIPVSPEPAACLNIGSKNNILIYGVGDVGDTSGMDNLDHVLSDAGYSVTALPHTTDLPSDLSGYGQIWHYGTDDLGAADQVALETFAQNGGSIFLTGEWGGNDQFANSSTLTILNAIVPMTITNAGDAEYPCTCPVNQSVIDGLATSPNALTTWRPSLVGGLAGVPTNNVFVTTSSGNAAGAVFEIGNAGGRLAVLMDVNWPQSQWEDTTTMPQVTQNRARFLRVGIA